MGHFGVRGTSSETRGKDSEPAYEAVVDEEDQVGSQKSFLEECGVIKYTLCRITQ